MSILDLEKYKLSQIVTKDLPVVIKRMEKAVVEMQPYYRYKSVSNCLRLMKNEIETLKTQLKYYNQVKETKGRK